MHRLLLAALFSLTLSACPEGRPAAPAECERIGDQCRVDEGQLGVCSPSGDQGCAEPPCLMCAPQH